MDCSCDELEGVDQTIAVQGFVLREVLFSNNRWGVIVCLAFCGERSGLKGLAARWGSAGLGLRGLRRLLKGWGFRAVREGVVCSPPRLASAESRCRPGAMVSLGRRCRLSQLSGSSGGRAISPKAPRSVRRSKFYRERRRVGRAGQLRRGLVMVIVLVEVVFLGRGRV